MNALRPATQTEEALEEALEAVAQAMRQRGLAEELIAEVKPHRHANDYEQRADTVYIALDDVGVKEQKAERVRPAAPTTDTVAVVAGVAEPVAVKERLDRQAPAAHKRPTVQNTVAQLERLGQRFTLTGGSVAQVLRFVLAFLLHNDLLAQRLRFFTDGQRSLQGAILAFFSWHPATSLVLDWYHLVRQEVA